MRSSTEVFRCFPNNVNDKSTAKLTTTTIGKLIGGSVDECYVVRIIDVATAVEHGEITERNAIISMSSANFLKLVISNLNTMKTELQSTIKVSSDKAAALAPSRVMEVPKPAR